MKRVKVEMEETSNDLDQCVTQIENCLDLLVPKPDKDHDLVTSEGDQTVTDDLLQGHGLFNAKTKIAIGIN